MSLFRSTVWFAKGKPRSSANRKSDLPQLSFKIIILIKGMREYTKGGYESAAKKFNAADLDVDLSNRSIMVTGSNSGIGKVTALEGKNPHSFFSEFFLQKLHFPAL
jgi:hypothetical protein